MNDQSIYINVESYGGSHISNVIQDMIGLADRLQIHVWSSFNGKRILARPGDDWDKLIQAWGEACVSKSLTVSVRE
jgi:hypothetical protein